MSIITLVVLVLVGSALAIWLMARAYKWGKKGREPGGIGGGDGPGGWFSSDGGDGAGGGGDGGGD